jgi:NTP pyrophosphatase (non-canonical NTP hydrolase)
MYSSYEVGSKVNDLITALNDEDEDYTDIVAAFRQRVEAHFTTPDLRDSYMYLVTEVGELGDLLLRALNGDRHTRGRQLEVRSEDFYDEIGDVLFMLATVAVHLRIPLAEALQHTLSKIESRIAKKEGEEC